MPQNVALLVNQQFCGVCSSCWLATIMTASLFERDIGRVYIPIRICLQKIEETLKTYVWLLKCKLGAMHCFQVSDL